MRVISARHRGQPRPSSRTRLAQAEQKRWWQHGTSAIRGFRGTMKHTHLAVVGVCRWWRVWCGVYLTFGLAVGVRHGSVVVVAVRAVVAVVRTQPAGVSTDTVAIIGILLLRGTHNRAPYLLGAPVMDRWSEKRFPHFHVPHFPSLQYGADFSCSAISCLAFSASP